MNTRIIEAIDIEIANLQQARSILTGSSSATPVAGRLGRPKGSKNAVKSAPVKAKRVLSAEGRAKIAEAQRKRHAAKKRAAKKAVAKAA